MRHSLYFLIFFLCIAGSGYTQTGTERWLQVSLGPSLLNRQDLIFSPFIHKDLSLLNGGLEYHKLKKRHQFLRLQYSGFSAGISTPFDYQLDGKTHTALPHSFTFVQLGYGNGWLLGKKENKPVVGFSLMMDVQAMNYQYGRFSFFGYYSATSLGAWYQHTIKISGKSRIIGTVRIPLVSWMARSPYLINDDEFIENTYSHNGFTTFFEYMADGHFATWNEWQSAEIGINYHHYLSQKWLVGAGWNFTFIHAALPKHLYSIQNNLSLVTAIKL